MTTGTLSAEMEALPHSARVRRAVELGRRSRSDAAATAELRAWEKGGFTCRLLAALACQGSRDSAVLAVLCTDPSRIISRVAFTVLGDVGDDNTLLAVLQTFPSRRLSKALFWLRRTRVAVIDRFLVGRLESGDPTAFPLLPLASQAVLDPYHAQASVQGGSVYWRRLGVFHPERAVTAIVARLESAESPDGLLFAHAGVVIGVVAKSSPDGALAVVAALRRHLHLARIPLAALLVARPVVVADLVLNSTDPVSISFDGVAHRIGVRRIVGLFRRSPHLLGYPDRWLRKLPGEDRAAVYRELAPAWTSSEGLVPVALLRRLPTTERVPEARLMTARPALAGRPLERLPYTALLPWAEAREQGKTWLGHPEADNRAAALVALCEATRFDRTRRAELLDLLTARKHEQDPVRQAFLEAIAGLPPSRWQPEHLPTLAQIIRHALDAGDFSGGSFGALGQLLFGLLPYHLAWAAEQLVAVARERGFPSGGLGRLLTPEDIRRIAPALNSVIRAWSDREHQSALLSLAACVHRRLPLWPELGRMLERMLRGAAGSSAPDQAMNLILQHLPAERERVVLETLARDESWVLHPGVMNYLHRRRQDLLTPFLGQRVYSGRFSTGKVRHVLPLASGFLRWTDSQQEIFADSLSELARAPASKKKVEVTWEALGAVRRLPALPAVGPERLIALARDERPAVRETAVRALGRLDARQGVPELLEALGDDRARFAVYALRSALSDLPGARVLEVMRGVPLAKVTVAKEAVRLAGEFGGVECLQWFAELDGQPLHRDVRGALLRALWDLIERPEAWELLDASARSPEVGVVIGLARIPVDRASPAARERVAHLLLQLLNHTEPTVRVAVLNRLTVQPVPDPNRVLLTAALDRLGAAIPDERSAALQAALAGARDADSPLFGAAFASLLPRRRELYRAVTEFIAQMSLRPSFLPGVRSATQTALESDPACVLLQTHLAVALLPAAELLAWVHRLTATNHWHTATRTTLLTHLTAGGKPSADLEALETAWSSSADAELRWMGLQLLVKGARAQGWDDARRARLVRYRQDASRLVADEAAFTFPPERGEASQAEN